MGEYILGYETSEICRKSIGSPATWVTFKNPSHSVLIDNLGSSPIYFAFDTVVNDIGSTTGFLNKNQSFIFDVKIGSISIQGSGLTSPEVQVIRLS